MSRRSERIGEQLRDELARLLREEVSDPRIPMLSVTDVRVAPDLTLATVSWSPLDPRVAVDVEKASAGLSSASGFLRRQLAHTLELRRIPELRFRFDDSIAKGSEMLGLLRELAAGEREGDDGETP